MFEHVLVPLDGSKLAASILLQVRGLLEAGERASLLLVVDPQELSEREVEEGLEDALAARLRTGHADLAGYLQLLSATGVRADGDVLLGDPAAVIVSEASLTQPSLVAMATHGRGGLTGWLRGSVAERVLHRCPVPLLLVDPRVGGDLRRPFRRLLVPLDGSPRAEEILPIASRFAWIHDAEVVLFHAWPEPQGEARSRTSLRREAALERTESSLRGRGLQVRVERGCGADVAEGILQATTRAQADLVALTTLGNTRRRQWGFGAVADKVLHHSPAPLLLHRSGCRALAAEAP